MAIISTSGDDDTAAYEAVSVADAGALGVPAGLYERARRYLLENEPLRARSSEGTSIAYALSATEIDALKSVGLSTERWRQKERTDPLAQSIADYMALLDTSLTTSQAAKYLKVDPSRIRQRLRERSLYGIEYDGERRLPRFQFERRKVIPGLAEVLAELRDPPSYSAVRGMLTLLEEKGHVRHKRDGMRYVYTPAIAPAASSTPGRARCVSSLVKCNSRLWPSAN